MIVKMLITFDYNPDTNEYTPLKQEIVKDTKKEDPAIKIAEEVKDSSEPQIVLTDNKYILNPSAASILGAAWGDRIDIRYQLIDKVRFPIIGTSTNWNSKSGNKLTKSLTVSCRGNANNLLSEFGDTFTLTPWQGHAGLYVMVGNSIPAQEPEVSDTNIEIKESQEEEEDLPVTKEEEELESLDAELDEILDDSNNEDKDNYEINDFNFEL